MRTRASGRPGLSKMTGGRTSCYPSPAGPFRRAQGREMRRNESFKVLGDLLAVGSSKPCIRVDDTLELKETSSVVGSSKPGPFKAAGGLASKVAFEPKV
jgi:hypothetical protein